MHARTCKAVAGAKRGDVPHFYRKGMRFTNESYNCVWNLSSASL